jgi:glycosyltransferase involved in cell wall biosynthesis
MLKYIEYEVEWVHFGDGTLKENIKNKASNLPPNIKVDFKGFVPNPKILEYYANNSVDLFINVSESEGIPVSIMEAISYGIPILATDVGGTSEIVTSQTGILLQKKFEPEEGSSIINKLITKRLVFSKSDIKAFWEQNYNAKNNYQELVNVFFSL